MKIWILRKMGFTAFVFVENLVGKDVLIAACWCFTDAEAVRDEAKKRWPHLTKHRVKRYDI